MEAATVLASKQHCKYCFDVLIAKLKGQPLPSWPSHFISIPLPLFVTWKITKNMDLRGCIGTFSHQQLSKVLPEYAITSAMQDPRFPPVDLKEVSGLTVAVSLLVNFQKDKKALQWQVGKHGIIIEFQDKGMDYRATYLPEVAAEQEWDQETTIKYLSQKAGFYGNYKNILKKIKVTTYQSSKQSLSYEEYLTMTK